MTEFTSLLCFTLITLGALGSNNELRIHNESEFIVFLNTSSDYTGTTVYLESDLDFSGSISNEFSPKEFFSGIFDGQGHVISNLVVKSSETNVGLFGNSYGGTIKNIIMDSSCFITSNFTGASNTYIGAVIGYINSNDGDTLITNVVNMANITFEGVAFGNYGDGFWGGIIGNAYTYYHEIVIKNCVNYGVITQSGSVDPCINIGGIVGHLSASSSSKIYIQNCYNYGAIVVNGTSGLLNIGGISGYTSGTSLVNCVSAGKILSNTGDKGGIVGYVESKTIITRCLWTSDVGCDEMYGTGTPLSVTDSSLVSINSTTVNELNEYRENNGWNKWILNTNNVSVTFIINNGREFSFSSQLILLPDISDNDNNVFDGWYADPYCSKPFESSEVTEETTLYGLYGSIVIVSFNANEGNVIPSSKNVTVNSTYGTLPTPNRDGYAFDGWFNENNELIANDSTVVITNDHIITAQWAICYTATFDLGNGTRIEEDFRVDETITYPQYVAKEGHSLEGWSPDIAIVDGKMPARDVTFTAQWTPNNYNATFKNGYDESDTTTKQVRYGENIEYPTISREGYTLDKWTSDVAIVDGKMPASDVTFTAEWSPNNYFVTFVLEDGIETKINYKFGERISYIECSTSDGYTFNGWDPDPEFMPSHNLTIVIVLIPNNYTVTFNVNGGNELDIMNIIVTFNSTYETLPTPNREGYTFIGWFDEKNKSVTNNTVVKIPNNHTLIAQWKEAQQIKPPITSSNQVEIVFAAKDMTEDEIKNIVKQYTDDENFEIVKYESSESGEMKVIIKFTDVENAQNFVETINTLDNNMTDLFKKVDFLINESIISSSLVLCPLLVFSLLLILFV